MSANCIWHSSHSVNNEPAAILSEPLQQAMSAWRWPLHFIDFETSRPALPYQTRRTPYDQILFQFSHHVLTEDWRLEHRTQCLEATPGMESSVPVWRALQAALSSDEGTVLDWWTHERTVISEIRKQIELDSVADAPGLVSFIDALLGSEDTPGRLADLGVLVSQCVFYPDTVGSSSIKKVLPAVLRQSPAIRSRYGTACYRTHELPSLNFKNWQWVVTTGASVSDPYDLLNPMFGAGELQEALNAVSEEDDEEQSDFIKNGGAALVAYDRLQQPELPAYERKRLETQLFHMVLERQLLRDCSGGRAASGLRLEP